jgi:hypothetical protein
MWKQNNLFGQQLPMNEQNPEQPPEGVCCESCYMAEEQKCVCQCGGSYHGLGRLNSREEKAQAGGEKA